MVAEPTHIYKILPNTSPYQGIPVPIPSDWTIPWTQLDLDTRFIHLNTKSQILRTLNLHFIPSSVADADPEKGKKAEKMREKLGDGSVILVKVYYKRLEKSKIVKWETERERGASGESHPHLYGELTGEFVETLKAVKRAGGEEDWDGVVRRLEAEKWLED